MKTELTKQEQIELIDYLIQEVKVHKKLELDCFMCNVIMFPTSRLLNKTPSIVRHRKQDCLSFLHENAPKRMKKEPNLAWYNYGDYLSRLQFLTKLKNKINGN